MAKKTKPAHVNDLNRGRIFRQRRPKKTSPSHRGRMNIDGSEIELTGWENGDRSISLRSETVEQAESARAEKGKKK